MSGLSFFCQHFWVRHARCPRELYEPAQGGIYVSQAVRNLTVGLAGYWGATGEVIGEEG